MFDYSAFGGYLRSDVEIPDLTPASLSIEPTWTLRLATEPPPDGPTLHRGTSEPLEGLVLHLFDTALGVRFQGDRVGVWDITNQGRSIECWLNTQEQRDFFGRVLLGPVLPLALEQAGLLCLHGSAVAFDGTSVAFLAPKLHGKSTVALALTLAGARLVTDDLVVVDLIQRPMLRPGAQALRLFGDSVEYLSAEYLLEPHGNYAKHTVGKLPAGALQQEAVVLGCVYILERTDAQLTEPAAQRQLLFGAEAVVSIAQRAKLSDDLIGSAAAGARLQQIAHLASQVHVYRLRVANEWDRFEEAMRTVRSWHVVTEAVSSPSSR